MSTDYSDNVETKYSGHTNLIHRVLNSIATEGFPEVFGLQAEVLRFAVGQSVVLIRHLRFHGGQLTNIQRDLKNAHHNHYSKIRPAHI
jgi:hypothetical protein